MADQETRGVARLAASIAVPVALVAGLAAYWALGRTGSGNPGPTLPSVHQDQAAFDDEVATTLMGRPVSPAEVAQALRYLIDARSVTGQMIVVDAGQHLTRATRAPTS